MKKTLILISLLLMLLTFDGVLAHANDDEFDYLGCEAQWCYDLLDEMQSFYEWAGRFSIGGEQISLLKNIIDSLETICDGSAYNNEQEAQPASDVYLLTEEQCVRVQSIVLEFLEQLWLSYALTPESLAGQIQEELDFNYNLAFTPSQLFDIDFTPLRNKFDRFEDNHNVSIRYSLKRIKDLFSNISALMDKQFPADNVGIVELNKIKDKVESVENKRIAIRDLLEDLENKQPQKNFHTRYEEGIKTTWCLHDDRYQIYPYIGRKDNGETWLRLRLGFSRSEWVFIQHGGSITMVIDGIDNRIRYDPYRDVDTSVHGGTISEWVDLGNMNTVIQSASKADRVIVVFTGSHGRRRTSHALSKRDLTMFRETVELYDVLKYKK